MKSRFILLAFLSIAAPLTRAHDGVHGPLEPVSPEAEALIHTAPGAPSPGEPRIADGADTATLRLRVVDAATGDPTFCRVNVIGPDGHYYEPDAHLLRPWSLHRLGNRKEKGPFRYYGWFFYCDGDESIRVPAGTATIEVWKGLEYRPVRESITLEASAARDVTVSIARTLDMAAEGWFSGDPHIHLNRRNAAEEERALDLVAAEDIRYGFLLGMNDARTFNGVPADQEWPQLRGMGESSEVWRGAHGVSSGYEYRNSTFGHILLLMADDLVFKHQVLRVDEWPTFAEVAKEARRLHGVAFHAHGGYEKEIYADYIPGATDGVELLQFAVYRGIGLEGWRHILNAGFRFPAIGASDFPYCRALGDCRTYVRLGEDKSMRAWIDAAVAGHSFFTTGPMLELTVNGAGPGETLTVDSSVAEVAVSVRARSEVAPIREIQIIANGAIVERFAASPDRLPQDLTRQVSVPINGSTWIAARAHGEQVEGLPDAEAHTNPVYVLRNGEPITNADSVAWLLDRLDAQIAVIEALEDFPRKQDVLAYYQECRALLAARL
ncbi:MAG: CehA/McbA family metallohydrolase [Candidatus Hydrogenedentes bacterium]|nr:CehA/McbA family metallohydrolase [Candidatus Hydrogenedentota bacterium]